MIFRRLSALAAEGLGAIISKDGEVLSRKCHATVRMLYAQVSVRHVRDACRFDTVRASQKVFCVSFPLLVEHVKAASADVSLRHDVCTMFAASESPCLQTSSVYSLLAIGFMCPHVPSSVLAQEVGPKQPHAPSKSREKR